jgi:peroxiredoxin
MAQLRQDYSQFTARDIEIVVVGPENASSFSSYWEKESLPFIGLPDPKASVLKLYGQEVNLFKLGRMPAQVLIDKAGIARYVHYGHSMSDIPQNKEILALGDEINAEKSRV